MNANLPASNFFQSGWLVMLAAVFAVGVASWCGTSLTYDGSSYLFQTLESQEPVTPHNRFINVVLLKPVIWLSQYGATPMVLARWHTLMSFMPLLVSLASVLLLLRGPLERLRWWAVAGVLIVPLPAIMCPTSEVVPALQLLWPLLAAVWAGARPWHWLLVLPGAVALYHTHPVATLCLAVAGLMGWFVGLRGDAARRGWRLAFGTAALLVAVSRASFTWKHLNAYERGQLNVLQGLSDLKHSLLCSSWLAVVGVLIIAFSVYYPGGGGWWHRAGRYLAGRGRWWLLAVAILPMSHPVLWSGALNSRKPAALLALAFAVIASMAALRHLTAKGRGATAPQSLKPSPSPVWLAVLFSAALCTGAWSWQRLTAHFMSELERQPGTVVAYAQLPGLGHTAAEHWSATTLGFVLQGREPRRVFLGPGVKLASGIVELYPGGWIRWEDAGWFEKKALR